MPGMTATIKVRASAKAPPRTANRAKWAVGTGSPVVSAIKSNKIPDKNRPADKTTVERNVVQEIMSTSPYFIT
jgi:hypothetical protein